MKFRKWTALAVAAALLASITGTALADNHDTTVPGAVYGQPNDSGTVPGQTATEAEQVIIEQQMEEQGIEDVPADHFAAGSIIVMVEAGLITPDSNGNINPDADISAEQGIAVFAKVLGLASLTDSDEEAAEKAKEAGLVTEAPNEPMPRLAVAKMLGKALGVKPKTIFTRSQYPFNDGWDTLSNEDKGLLAALYEMGVFKGFPDRTFQPNSILTTAQIAILIDRILGAQ